MKKFLFRFFKQVELNQTIPINKMDYQNFKAI